MIMNGHIVSRHNRVSAQLCMGTILCGHKRVWAQSCLGINVCGHKRVGPSINWHNRVVSEEYTFIYSILYKIEKPVPQ